ncbi:hypothetical protein VZ94_01530 [Methylocucumis oryzae]|uniref:Uncharacterized protein n=1 Tax=Methylocucumis oryzae TaxID=1632867 RepID=A0A0F3IMH9_9GAMM|nr:hypothetical protein VZ94_01530 [Methylocucumis oryzae]
MVGNIAAKCAQEQKPNIFLGVALTPKWMVTMTEYLVKTTPGFKAIRCADRMCRTKGGASFACFLDRCASCLGTSYSALAVPGGYKGVLSKTSLRK